MSKVMVRYTVKPERAEENVQLVRAVYEELARTEPVGLRYATFQHDDGVSFVHLASYDGDENPLRGVAAFQEFQRDASARCAEPPVVTSLSEVGSFRFWQ